MRIFWTVLFNAILLLGCQDSTPTKWQRSYATKFISTNITAWGDSSRIETVLQDLLPWLEDFQQRYRSGGPLDSLVYSAQTGDTIPLDSESFHIFSFALWFRDYSHGEIDVGVGNLLHAWKISWQNDSARVPSDSELIRLTQDLQSPLYAMDSAKQAMIVLKTHHHFALGAFLEGAILEHIGHLLDSAECNNWLVDVSGDFLYRGTKPQNAPWRLGIKDPAQPSQLLATVDMLPGPRSFCTSGDYEQQFTDARGHRHHHILDPHTGQSTQGKHSVSVTTSLPDMNPNTLCTWFMILPLDSIQALTTRSQGQIEAIVVQDSQKIWVSSGLRPRMDVLVPGYQITP
ncbi:MAG TPA: FAD:protein FMN transferase [Fibrobacteraceae bacterium]|nr:FAD:protein FMN transferase [Fibrobacteraceae bacterium]